MSNFCKIIHLPVDADFEETSLAPSCLLPHVLFRTSWTTFWTFMIMGEGLDIAPTTRQSVSSEINKHL